MKIAIDTTPWLSNPSGMGIYVANLIHEFDSLKSHEQFEFDLIYQPRFGQWIRGNLAVPKHLELFSVRRFPLPVRLSNVLIEFPQLFLPQIERSFGSPDLVHATNYSVFPFKKSCTVLTIYDLTFVKYPQFATAIVKAYKNRIRKCLKWTDLILTISHSTKRDIVEYFEVDPERICVTHLASRYRIDQFYSKPDFPKPYILFVSTIEPRKNLKTLISAFEYLKQKYKLQHELVLIGQKGWLYEPIFEQIARSPYHDSIHHLDYLSDDRVAQFYAHADVFVYPSHYEGFGMPVLEAMTLGAPVITTNTSALPEVVRNAAILVEPNEVVELAEAIAKIISDRAFRDQLVQLGKNQAKLFSWENTAKETLNAYRSIL